MIFNQIHPIVTMKFSLLAILLANLSAWCSVNGQAEGQEKLQQRMPEKLSESTLKTNLAQGINLSHFNGPNLGDIKSRSVNFCKEDNCEAFRPFRCPGHGKCLPIQHLCDGTYDCEDGYDEDPRMCTAAIRPPFESVTNFLNDLLQNHGPNFFEAFFGPKARNQFKDMGGVDNVAIALSESWDIEEFGSSMKLDPSDVDLFRSVFEAVEDGDMSRLKLPYMDYSEIKDVEYFLNGLVETGFLG